MIDISYNTSIVFLYKNSRAIGYNESDALFGT